MRIHVNPLLFNGVKVDCPSAAGSITTTLVQTNMYKSINMLPILKLPPKHHHSHSVHMKIQAHHNTFITYTHEI